MGSCCTKKGNRVGKETLDYDQKHKSKSPSLKTRAESHHEYSDDENSTEYQGDLQNLTPTESILDYTPIISSDSDSSDSSYTSTETTWEPIGEATPPIGAPETPSSGSSFSILCEWPLVQGHSHLRSHKQ